jgi:hypothetical protein
VTDTGRIRSQQWQSGRGYPGEKLADEAPIYQREFQEPEYIGRARFHPWRRCWPTDPVQTLKTLLAWRRLPPKNWVYRQV